MANVSYSENVLEINSTKFELPEEIQNVVTAEQIVIVHFSKGEMDPRSVVAFDSDGNKLWRIPPLKKGADSGASRVNLVAKDDATILVFAGSQRYEVDPHTGEVEHLGWYRG